MFLENHFQETFIDTFLVHVIFRIAASELWWRLSGINLRTLSDTTHTHTHEALTPHARTHTHTPVHSHRLLSSAFIFHGSLIAANLFK